MRSARGISAAAPDLLPTLLRPPVPLPGFILRNRISHVARILSEVIDLQSYSEGIAAAALGRIRERSTHICRDIDPVVVTGYTSTPRLAYCFFSLVSGMLFLPLTLDVPFVG